MSAPTRASVAPLSPPAKKQRAQGRNGAPPGRTGSHREGSGQNAGIPAPPIPRRTLVAAAILVLGVWSYWPTLVELVATWWREPDYSHGFLVLPVAAYCLWIRRETFPGWNAPSPLLAAGLLITALAMRVVGARLYFTFLDGWSILPWLAAVVAAAGGVRLLLWSLPALGFCFFMIPLPHAIAGEMSYPLQKIATRLSCLGLQTLGQPAFADGNVILLHDQRFEVAQACSGLRLFVSILALTYAYVAIISRPWWEKLGLCLIAIPVAIVSNAVRIMATALLYELTASETLRQWAHDSAGWGTILFAGILLAGALYYFRWLIREEELMDLASLARRSNVQRPTVED